MLFADHPGEVEVRSAGYYPQNGRPSPDEALAGAQRAGLSLEGHRARVADDAIMAWCDVAIVFDNENMKNIREKFPDSAVKSHYLGCLSDGAGVVMVSDPYGRGDKAFDEVYAKIDRLVERLAAAIRETRS